MMRAVGDAQDAGRASVPAPTELGRWRFAVERLRRGLTLAGKPRSDGEPSSDLEHRFIARCAELPSPSVLELGTAAIRAGPLDAPPRLGAARRRVPRHRHPGRPRRGHRRRPPPPQRGSRHRALRRDPLGVDLRAPQVPHPGRPRADEGPQGRWPAVHPDPPVVPAARLPERLLPLLAGRAGEPVRHDHGLRGRGDQLRLPGAALLAAGRSAEHMPAFLNTTLWGEKRAPTPDEYRYEL